MATPATAPNVPNTPTQAEPEIVIVVGPPQRIPLDPKLKKAWEDTRTALLWGCPAFSHILYTLLDRHEGEDIAFFTDAVPIAATDGVSLILNPDTFFKMPLFERVFVCAHEILHCILGHMEKGHAYRASSKVTLPNGTSLPYDHQLMNAAMDYVINAILVDSKVGSFPSIGLHDPKIATAADSVIDTYAKLFKDQKGKGGGKGAGQGQGQNPGGFDVHLAPGSTQGKDPQTAAGERSEATWQAEVAAGMHSARVQGKLPAGLDRALGEVISPKVAWQDHIRAIFNRSVGTDSINWRKPERRYIVQDIYVPESAGFGADTVVVAIDTSGSIGQNELDRFFGELYGIIEDVNPERVEVVWCDAQVHRVDVLESVQELAGLRQKKAPGGGGTAFEPVFDYLGGNPRIDALVYLTDGYGSFPQQVPNYPVIWGDITNTKDAAKRYPFGEVVEIPR